MTPIQPENGTSYDATAALNNLLLYEYRFLKTETGTWGSRDPIGEDDGANI